MSCFGVSSDDFSVTMPMDKCNQGIEIFLRDRVRLLANRMALASESNWIPRNLSKKHFLRCSSSVKTMVVKIAIVDRLAKT